MYWLGHYVVDWDRVQTLDDVKVILKALDIAFEPDSLAVTSIAHLLKKEPKPPIGAVPL
jgi:hypothetical protein